MPVSVELLKEIMNSAPAPSELIKKHLNNNVSHLLYILWGKSDAYEGPLFDGFQKNDWALIIMVVGNWVMEVYTNILQDKAILQKEVELFASKKYVTELSFYIVEELVERKVVPGLDQDDLDLIRTIKGVQPLYDAIERNIGAIIAAMESLMGVSCCGCFKKNNLKKVAAEARKRSEEQGKMAAMENEFASLTKKIESGELKKTDEVGEVVDGDKLLNA